MKKTCLALIGLVSSVGCQVTFGCIFAPDDLKTYVQQLNVGTAKAFESKDSHFFENLFTKDFKARDEHGAIMGRKESLFVVRFQMNTIKVLDYKASAQSIKLEKGRGTVITQAKLIGLTMARRGRPSEKLEITRKWSDLYQKQSTGWTLISRTELVAPVVKTTPLTLLVPPVSAKTGKAAKHSP